MRDGIISMFDKKSAPIINELAMEFALFDHWFCSVPGPTEPNREYATSGKCYCFFDAVYGVFVSFLSDYVFSW